MLGRESREHLSNSKLHANDAGEWRESYVSELDPIPFIRAALLELSKGYIKKINITKIGTYYILLRPPMIPHNFFFGWRLISYNSGILQFLNMSYKIATGLMKGLKFTSSGQSVGPTPKLRLACGQSIYLLLYLSTHPSILGANFRPSSSSNSKSK